MRQSVEPVLPSEQPGMGNSNCPSFQGAFTGRGKGIGVKRILVVDNDELILDFIKDVLAKEGHQIITAQDGLSALDILVTYKPDLIFLDLVMPHINGRKLCRIIRQLENLKDVFLVILSATATEDQTDLAELGANVCIAKGPFKVMKKHILKALEQSDLDPPPHVSAGIIGIETIFPRGITKELLSVERHLEVILESMSEGILETMPNGRIVYANPAALRLCDMSDKEILGAQLSLLFDGDDRRRVQEVLKSVRADRGPVYKQGVTLKGHQVMLDALPVNGEEPFTIMILNDITEQIEAEATLNETNRFLKSIIDGSSSIAITYTDLDHHILFWNKGAEKIFGYRAEEVVDTAKIDILYPNETTGRVMNRLRSSVIKSRDEINFEIQHQTRDGRKLWINWNLAPRFGEDGSVKGILGIGGDVSDQKRLEDQLKHAQKMESLGTITSGVAHNFRNILASISMSAQLIEMKYKADPRLEEISTWINTSLKRGVYLVEGLMQFSRKQASEEFQLLNLSDLILETYEITSKSFDKKIEIHADVPESLTVLGSPSGLSQVLMNLCTNARDAMPEGGKLHIRSSQEKNSAVVVVSDTGHGMDKELQEKCFDPFFTTKEVGKGTGLGLSTAYGIIKDHGGEIHVYSEPGKGTSFKFYLPLSAADEKPREASPQDTVMGKGQKILVVDDDIEILRPIKSLLEELGYVAEVSTSGKAAIDTYRAWHPQVVLLDRNMPEMDGLTCAREIISQDPGARIVLFSGYEEEGPNGIDDETKAIIKGYFTKPVDMEDLARVLAQVLR
jgi:PAS domain S-box-containing protein